MQLRVESLLRVGTSLRDVRNDYMPLRARPGGRGNRQNFRWISILRGQRPRLHRPRFSGDATPSSRISCGADPQARDEGVASPGSRSDRHCGAFSKGPPAEADDTEVVLRFS